MSPRPEIVLPPGFALRIDYDPAASPASLLITAYRDETPVGQAHVDPREIGLRLRLELATDGSPESSHEPRLRLTPSRAMRAIEMSVVREPVPPREVIAPAAEPQAEPQAEVQPEQHAAMAALHELALDSALGTGDGRTDDDPQRTLNALVWLEHGGAVVLPSTEVKSEAPTASPLQRAFRALSGAAELLANPLRLRDAEEGWASWRATWRSAPQTGGASEG